MEILLATSNPGKVREVKEILGPERIEVVLLPIWLGEIETGVTYLENATIKATSAVRLAGRAVLAEDSGIEIDTLGGRPGPHASRFAGPAATDQDNVDKVLRLMDGTPDHKRTARYRAVAVLALPSGRMIRGEGTLEGRIAGSARGTGGFGYDPIFIPEGQERTGAELSPEEKNAISHRGRALRALLEEMQRAGLTG